MVGMVQRPCQDSKVISMGIDDVEYTIAVLQQSQTSSIFRIKCSDKMDGKFVFLELHLVHFSTVPDCTVAVHANTVLDHLRSNKYDV